MKTTKRSSLDKAVSVQGDIPKKELRTQALEPTASMVDGIPQPDDYQSLNRSYELHSWVYAAAWAIASNYAQMEYKAFRENDQQEWEEYDKHDWVKLLKKPNPYMSAYQMREMVALSLDLSGNSYWIIEKDPRSGKSKYIWTIPSHQMLAVSSKSKVIDYYIYDVNGEKIRFEYSEVVHLKYSNPRDLVYGQGSLAAVKMAVMSDIYAQNYNRYFFKNASRPDAVLESDITLGEDVRKRVMEAWKAWTQGVENRGKTVMLEGGLKMKEINRSMKDMEFTALRKYSREEILGAFGVPPIMVGILESANMANSKEQVRLFWQHSIMPRARSIQDQLTMRIQQLTFDPLTVFESDAGSVEAMQRDFNALADVATKFVNIGIPLNEVIDKLDLPFEPVDEAKLAADAAAAAAASGKPAGDPPKPQPDDQVPTDKPAAVPPKANRAIKMSVWKAFDISTRTREEDLKMGVRAFFRGQRRRVLAALDAHAGSLLNGVVEKDSKPLIDIHIIFDVKKEQDRMRETTDPNIGDTYLDFAVKTTRRYGIPGTSFDLYNPRVLAILEEKELKIVRLATATTKEALSEAVVEGIRESVADGLKQGDAIRVIADRINEKFDLAVESRAETIARTEILGAANAGTLEGIKASGVEKKEWLPPQDGPNARDWHQKLGDDPIPVDQKFVTELGNAMDSPHDPGAPAEEVVNCRCTLIGVRGDA